MSIRVQDLLDAKARKYGASRESVQFQQLVIDAINYTLDDIQSRVGIDTTRVARMQDAVNLDQQTYQGLLSVGTDFYLQDNSEYSIQSSDRVAGFYQDKLRQARNDYMTRSAGVNIFGRLGDFTATTTENLT